MTPTIVKTKVDVTKSLFLKKGLKKIVPTRVFDRKILSSKADLCSYFQFCPCALSRSVLAAESSDAVVEDSRPRRLPGLHTLDADFSDVTLAKEDHKKVC